MNLGGLATGLSSVYPGELAAESQSQKNDLQKLQLDQAQAEIAGKQALGRVFQQMVPGAQSNMPPPPQQAAPQAPPPGQPSQPMRPPQPPPQAAAGPPPGPAVGGARGPQPGMPVGGPPGGAQPPGPPGGGQPNSQMLDRFDLKTAAQAIARANPGIKPQVLVEALNAALPYLNAEAKQQVAEMRQAMQQDNLNLKRDTLDARERMFEEREKRIKDEEDRRQKRFETREARLEAQNEIKNDTKVRELDLKQKYIEKKIADGDRNFNMKMWRETADAKRKAALAAATLYSVNNGMDEKQKAKLAKDVNDSAEEEITNMRNLQGSSTPTGGTPKADGSKTSARVGDQPKPIPEGIRSQFDKLVKERPDLREEAIAKMKADGYITDGL